MSIPGVTAGLAAKVMAGFSAVALMLAASACREAKNAEDSNRTAVDSVEQLTEKASEAIEHLTRRLHDIVGAVPVLTPTTTQGR